MRSLPAFFLGRGLTMFAVAVCFYSLFPAAAQNKPAIDPPSQSQAATAAKPAPPPDFSKEGLVLEKAYTRIRMEADGTGTRQITGRTRILADSGVKEMAVLTFTYTASNQRVDIGYVRVIKPDGTVVVTPDYNVQDMPADVTREAPMYSDIHQKHVAVKGLGVGDILESQVTFRTLKAEIPDQFWYEYSFEKNIIILDEQLDLDLPADKNATVLSPELQPTIRTAGGRKFYHWSRSNLARPDPDAPPKSIKHLKPSIEVTTFTSWEQIGAWYQSLQKEPLAVTPAIQAKVAALTKGLTTDEEKIRAIFNDVALHIHYVGLEFGIGRYQPHPADDVLSNEYGDCKDKHTLLASLLKAAGIEAWPVLISSGRELDPAAPSPAQFNHVITLVPLSGKLLWMDSTEEVAPIGVLMSILRDKQGLAVPPGKPAYLERTPAVLPFAQSVSFNFEGKLSAQGLLTGHIAQSCHGDAELILRTVFRQIPQSQWKEGLQRYSSAVGFGGEVANPQISDIEQTSQPFQFSYDYTREKFYQWDEHDNSHWIGPPMPGMGGELAPGVKEKKPADEPELESPGETVYQATIQLPTGWSMEPPRDVDLKEDWLEYHAHYRLKDGAFTAKRSLLVKKTKVPLDQWEKYLAFRRGMFEDWNRQALISPPESQRDTKGIAVKGLPVALHPGWVDPSIKESVEGQLAALKPMMKVAEILTPDIPPSSQELALAIDLAQKDVESVEETSLTLPAGEIKSLYWAQILACAWTNLGWASLEAHDLPKAESYLRAAWQLSQDPVSGYQLGRLLEAKGDKAAAAHLYELAFVSSPGGSLDNLLYPSYNATEQIGETYEDLTRRPLHATALNHGQYNGSLRAELDKGTEIRGFTPVSKLNGQGLFAVAYEAGKPVKANFLQGDRGLESMTVTLEGHRFPVTLPSSSKARLLREVRLICTPYGGCDAYMLLPTSIVMPSNNGTLDVSPPHSPPGTKTIRIPTEP
jgi:hypothetical protein